MRIEPVYLLAPKPKRPTIPTRRALLLAGATFIVGIGLGGACGRMSSPAEFHDVAIGAPLAGPSGDVELDELRQLAVNASIEELLSSWSRFTEAFSTRYRNDAYLPYGINRLIEHVIANQDIDQRMKVARVLADTVELGEPSLQQHLGHYVRDLLEAR